MKRLAAMGLILAMAVGLQDVREGRQFHRQRGQRIPRVKARRKVRMFLERKKRRRQRQWRRPTARR